LLARTVFRSRDDLSPNVSADAVPAEVHVHARGTVFSHQVRVPSGDPRNPMTTNERLEKFVDCVAGSYPADQAREMFDNFERLDQRSLLDGLVQPTKRATALHHPSEAVGESA
jgi:2-methylcitrate dehydratase PrpD